jgi:hypothetical protein
MVALNHIVGPQHRRVPFCLFCFDLDALYCHGVWQGLHTRIFFAAICHPLPKASCDSEAFSLSYKSSARLIDSWNYSLARSSNHRIHRTPWGAWLAASILAFIRYSSVCLSLSPRPVGVCALASSSKIRNHQCTCATCDLVLEKRSTLEPPIPQFGPFATKAVCLKTASVVYAWYLQLTDAGLCQDVPI